MKISDLPIKAKKLKKKKIQLHYLVLNHKDEVYVRQRKGLGVWEGLYDFPSIETENEFSDAFLLEKAKIELNIPELNLIRTVKKFKHILSHIEYTATFWTANIKAKPEASISNCKWIKSEQIGEFPISRLVEKFLEA